MTLGLMDGWGEVDNGSAKKASGVSASNFNRGVGGEDNPGRNQRILDGHWTGLIGDEAFNQVH